MSNKDNYRPHMACVWEHEQRGVKHPHNLYSIADAHAIQALMRGEADSIQQKRAMDWIINIGSKLYDLHYFDDQRDTDFALGKAFVGSQILKLSKLDTNEMEKALKQKERTTR